MSPRNVTEEEFKQLVQNRDRDPVERVRGTAPRTAMTNWKDSPEANHSPKRKVSGSNINPRLAPSPYKSKWEAAYAGNLELQKRAKLITDYCYEPFSLWLPGGVRYKPDFLVWREYPCASWHNEITIIEVKGFSKNRRDGMTRLKIAAALFPCFSWQLVTRDGRGWRTETL